MNGIRFNPDVIKALRERVAHAQAPLTMKAEPGERDATHDSGLVQLNVRVRLQLKQRIHELARRRQSSLADVIEAAIKELDRKS